MIAFFVISLLILLAVAICGSSSRSLRKPLLHAPIDLRRGQAAESDRHMSPERFPAGVVTLLQWTMMPDGATYMHLWASNWTVVTNAVSGIAGLRTVDRYHLVSHDPHGKVRVIIPGCQVKGFAACPSNPSLKGGAQAFTVDDIKP